MDLNLEGLIMHAYDSDTEAILKKVKQQNSFGYLQISPKAPRKWTLEDLPILQREQNRKETKEDCTKVEEFEVVQDNPNKKIAPENGQLDGFTKVTYKRKKKQQEKVGSPKLTRTHKKT